jgi:rhamnosyltransferase
MRSSEGLYYPRLDHVRAAAAFLVFFYHFVHVWGQVPVTEVPSLPITSLFTMGYTGISLFMVLSGYLFAKIVDDRRLHYPTFLWNRVVRLAPLLTAAMIYAAIFHGLELRAVLAGFVLPVWPSGAWSIAVELHFYILFPLLLILQRRFGTACLLTFLVLAMGVRAYFWAQGQNIWFISYFSLIGRIDQFILGMVFFRLSSHPLFKRWPGAIFFAALIVFSLVWHRFNRAGLLVHGNPTALHIILPTIEGLAYAAIIAAYENMTFKMPAVLDKALAFVGTVSYSIYLTHLFVIFGVFARIPSPGRYALDYAAAFAAFPFFVAIAWVTYSLFERPFFRFRRKYAFRAGDERQSEFLVIPAAADLAAVRQQAGAHVARR